MLSVINNATDGKEIMNSIRLLLKRILLAAFMFPPNKNVVFNQTQYTGTLMKFQDHHSFFCPRKLLFETRSALKFYFFAEDFFFNQSKEVVYNSFIKPVVLMILGLLIGIQKSFLSHHRIQRHHQLSILLTVNTTLPISSL